MRLWWGFRRFENSREGMLGCVMFERSGVLCIDEGEFLTVCMAVDENMFVQGMS